MFEESLIVLLGEQADPVAAGWKLRELTEQAADHARRIGGGKQPITQSRSPNLILPSSVRIAGNPTPSCCDRVSNRSSNCNPYG